VPESKGRRQSRDQRRAPRLSFAKNGSGWLDGRPCAPEGLAPRGDAELEEFVHSEWLPGKVLAKDRFSAPPRDTLRRREAPEPEPRDWTTVDESPRSTTTARTAQSLRARAPQ
jgi:hypothetical protein